MGNGRSHSHDGDSREYDRYGESAEYSAEYSAKYDAAGHGRADYDDYGDSAEYDAYGATGESEGMPVPGRAMVPVRDEEMALALAEDSGPLVVPGSGLSMGNPFIKRRERPLTMRLAIIMLTACVMVTGLFAVTPLGSNADGNMTTFQQIAGSVVLNGNVGYRWVVAKFGDTPEKWAATYHCQVGGIYELNNLLAGQELQLGKAYKVPEDPNYGANFLPPSLAGTATGTGATTFGNSLWDSYAGTPPPEAICDSSGQPGNPLSYHLLSPNKGAWWVRGFSWYHNGVDLAAPEGNPIHPVQAGQVIWAGWDFGGFGYSVKINHCNGLSSVYGHMMKLNVTAGQNVTPSDIIGWEGSTGWSTGPHLHLSILVNNVMVDPMPFFGNSEYNITLNPSYK